MLLPTLAALIIDINHSAEEGAYVIELKWRPESPGVRAISADARTALREAEKALQAHFILGVPIEFRGETYETPAEAIEAIEARIQEWT